MEEETERFMRIFSEDVKMEEISEGHMSDNEYIEEKSNEIVNKIDSVICDEMEEPRESMNNNSECMSFQKEDEEMDDDMKMEEEIDMKQMIEQHEKNEMKIEKEEIYEMNEDKEYIAPPPPEKIGLEDRGYLFLKGVYSKDLIDRLHYEVQSFMNQEGIYSQLQKRQDVPQQRYYVNNTYGSLQNFQQIQHYYVPVIDNRGTYNRVTDMGVIDFYNVDRLFPQIRTYFDVQLMLMILYKSTGIEWKLTRVNLQYYNTVTNPNAYHVDNGNEKNIKFTIYLSDIMDDLSGPITFMEGTHISKKNVKMSQTKIFTGEKGDVLISYQNGYHRRLPQKTQGMNGFLTFHFTTKYERDRYFPISLY